MDQKVVSERKIYYTMKDALFPLVALCLAFFVEMVDNTVLTIAMPTIGRDLHTGPTGLQWITGAYSLTFGALLLTGGLMADKFGRRKILMIGLAGFGVISSFVWFVNDIDQLIAIRAALGVAASCMAPVTISLIFRLFDDEKLRMRAINIVTVVGMSGFAFGPILAGAVIGHIGWKWLLLVNVPVALVAALGVSFGIEKDHRDDLHNERIDLPGVLFTAGFMTTIIYLFTSGVNNGWSNWLTITCGVLAPVFAILFVVRERRTSAPMLDLEILQHKTIRGAIFIQMAGNLGMAAAMFLVSMHYQYAWRWSPLKAGLGNLPFIVTMLLATPLSEKCAAVLGHKLACIVGSFLSVAGLLGMFFSVVHGFWPLAASIVVMMVGIRIVMSICAIALVDAMPENRTSIGAALNDTSQEIGTSFGVAIVGTVVAIVAGKTLPEGVWNHKMVDSFFRAEKISYAVLTIVVAVIAAYGCSTLTNSHSTEDNHS